MQNHSSANTSMKQVPAAHKIIAALDGYREFNVDIGGGKYNAYMDVLHDIGVECAVYDPMNRSEEDNEDVQVACDLINGFDTATCHNVLNVIDDIDARLAVIQLCFAMTSIYGVAYFSVYEGNKTGKGRISKKDCWQENRVTKDYMSEIGQIFHDVERVGKLIIASKKRISISHLE